MLTFLLLAVAASVAPSPPADPADGEWPLQPPPAVVNGFSPPTDPWGPGHRGVDLAGGVGQRVHAALPGRVSYAGLVAGRGVVVVDHGDTRTTYEPVLASVSAGEQVAAGSTLGTLTGVGSHCLPAVCLHWGWLRGKTYLDPLDLVGAEGGPVRLLPLWVAEPAAPREAPTPPSPVHPYDDWRPLGQARG